MSAPREGALHRGAAAEHTLGRARRGGRRTEGGHMNIAFTTCVRLGRSCIEAIYDLGGRLELMVTLRDDLARGKSGRAYLDDLAREHGVPLLKVGHINDPEVPEALARHRIDWLFIIGWSQIAGEAVLKAPARGCIGMHPTLLPEGRGRASVPWAILKGLDRTGVTMFRLDSGVDTGDIIAQGEIPMDPRTVTATELYARVEEMHVRLVRENWGAIVGGSVRPVRQDGTRATVWPGRRPEDGELLPSMTMEEADRMVRAVTRPYPGAFYLQEGRKVTVWRAAVSRDHAEGALRLADGFLVPLEYEVRDTGGAGA